ncbi:MULTISPECIES: TetR/AcrR family transcriptional regulator [unclassified Pseudonocardia]|uniref:TetR/AcrR family transcriptional regulator n=1 Tax=unclassified Pseudonocardia TaxID=2619320 RepID=UPI0001FFE611|nr:TetR/AcrR family transcriptional regulator [Pseudonocardia sp. Ae707_Ps1]OLM18407.1 Transcriptional regulator, TetR family [Pseudonocardia sp. Ae707_Ps1]
MRSDSRADGQKTFIEQARRRQIIEAAVTTVAGDGFGNASLAAIARTAGISKGVISYHFSGKEELMEECVTAIYTGIAERVVPQLEGLAPLETVRAHVLAVARDGVAHRDELVAVGEIVTHLRRKDGRLRYGVTTNEDLYLGLEWMYGRAVEAGEVRRFDHRVMAVTVQSALDSMFAYWIARPETDLVAYSEELADLLVAAIRRPEGEGS